MKPLPSDNVKSGIGLPEQLCVTAEVVALLCGVVVFEAVKDCVVVTVVPFALMTGEVVMNRIVVLVSCSLAP